MNRIFFDIETTSRPEHELLAIMPEFEAPGNYKAPEAIAKAVAEKRATWLDKAALSAETGRIVAIGYINDGLFTDSITDEATMLRSLWASIQSARAAGHLFIGFNIARFDLPFCIRRSWALNVRVPSGIFKGRYLDDRVFIDLAETWQMGNREEYISLKRLALFLGVGDKNADNSKNFGALLLSNRAEAIAHLENDLRLTEAVANRLLGPVTERRAPGIMAAAQQARAAIEEGSSNE